MKKNYINYTFFLIAIVLIWLCSNINWGKEGWRGILESDAKGYYAYLPAVFIYHDLNFDFFDEIEKGKYYQEHIFYDYRSNAQGVLINKYYCGVALAQSPFFLLAHFVSYLDNQDLDGYSKWYMISVSIAAIFYHLLGLWFLIKLLRLYRIKESVILMILIGTSFGTNLFVYTIVEGGMSHVFSFAFIAQFLYFARMYFLQLERKYLLLMAFSFAMLVLCRPINALIIFGLPFIAGDFKVLKNGLFKLFKQINGSLIALLIIVVIVGIQFLIYKISTGHFFVYSYDQEGFNFLDPHLIDILFSYKKGLFLYTPIYLIACISGFRLRKKSGFQFFSWFVFFLLITYVFSSWWMWFYGGSFSSRVYVEYIPLFMLVLALSINEVKRKIVKRLSFAIIILLSIVCQIQSYQYRYYDIHYSEMTKEMYWNVFLMRNKF